ncbi:hypothetical protein OG949_37395 [Streptomyces scopuliridis]|uniref:hypothetical protein n=1 Tax=Streptomyces scopuliridis TaxID=452529 RepID=UPI002DDA6C36|nr:hypothetical protein [Streptomyces scopuliridis]WSB37950.1 hypothetical protein OG949_37395 [Streptomyces scopuliridis]
MGLPRHAHTIGLRDHQPRGERVQRCRRLVHAARAGQDLGLRHLADPRRLRITLHSANGCNSNIDTWFLELARDGQWVCAGSPIPTGYVLTGHISTGCGNIGVWFQQLVRVGVYICPGVPIPAGYRTDAYNASMCGGLGGWLLLSA